MRWGASSTLEVDVKDVSVLKNLLELQLEIMLIPRLCKGLTFGIKYDIDSNQKHQWKKTGKAPTKIIKV